jgi:hypothetical protein
MSDGSSRGRRTARDRDPHDGTPVHASSSWFQNHRTLEFPLKAREPTLKRIVGAPEPFLSA